MKQSLILFVMSLISIGVARADHADRSDRASISYRISQCYSDMCTAELDWRTSYGNAVVTVEIPGETQEKLYACTERYGYGSAPWIAKNKQYVFRVYESNRCTSDVGYYDRVAASVTVFVRDDDGNGGRGRLSAYRERCYSDLCTYNVSWRSNGNSTVVTVQIPGETGERLMSCEGSSGTAHPNWIARNKDYVFRLYVSDRCSADVGRYERPVDRITVREY